VTFFFNGGVEKQFDGEDCELIPSPKVATYDKQPEMSSHGVAEKVAETLKEGKYEFIMCNFAPPDMVCACFPSPPSPSGAHNWQ
jgi:2,3-bisphosphoglycerate-independent phosphoglycerate mutase